MRALLVTTFALSGLAGCAWDPPRDARQALRTDASFEPPDQGVPEPDQGPPERCDPAITVLDARNAVGPDRWVVEGTIEPGSGGWAPACGGSSGAEAVFALPAPTAGRWIINTAGSAFDTVLALYDGCEPAQASLLACNDDEQGLTSGLDVRLDGASIHIVVDAFSPTEGGTFALDVRRHTLRREGEVCAIEAADCEADLACWWGDEAPVCWRPEPRFEGDRCAPDGRIGACVEGTRCQGEGPAARCVREDAACPNGIPFDDLNQQQVEDNVWRTDDERLGGGVELSSCLFGGEVRPTRVWRFEAVEAGWYRVATFRSGGGPIDTVLDVSSGCVDPALSLVCDDDGGEGVFSAAELALEAGQVVYIKVSNYGFSDEGGRFGLRVTRN